MNDFEPARTGAATGSLPDDTIPQTAELVAHERSPTLMAGESPGAQGDVRIWYPDRALMLKNTLGLSLWLLLTAIIGLTSHVGWLFIYFFISICFTLSAYAAVMRRPCYVTTDTAGLAITTRSGSQALRWQDICSMNVHSWFSSSSARKIQLGAPGPVEINLTGYPTATQNELFVMIATRAALRQHPFRKEISVNLDPPMLRETAGRDAANPDAQAEPVPGRKARAVKLYRELRNLNEPDTRDALDQLELLLEVNSMGALFCAQVPDRGLRRELIELIRENRKREAMKLCRSRAYLSRTQSLKLVEVLGYMMTTQQAVEPSPQNAKIHESRPPDSCSTRDKSISS